MNVELFKGSDGWRWRLVADQGEILATSEAYTRKTDARRTAKLVYNAFLKGDPEAGYEEIAPLVAVPDA